MSRQAPFARRRGQGLDDTTITPRPDLGEIPIVALTADAFADDVARARAAGMNAHMSKPWKSSFGEDPEGVAVAVWRAD